MSVGYSKNFQRNARALKRPLFTVDFDSRHLKDDPYHRTIQGVIDPRHESFLRDLMRMLSGAGGPPLCTERDLDTQPYSVDEARVAAYLSSLFDGKIGAGDDPIGFLIASHSLLAQEAKRQAGFAAQNGVEESHV